MIARWISLCIVVGGAYWLVHIALAESEAHRSSVGQVLCDLHTNEAYQPIPALFGALLLKRMPMKDYNCRTAR